MVHGNEHTMHTIKSRTQQIIIFLHWIFRRFLNDNQITPVLISWQVCDDILVQDNVWQSFPEIKMSLWVTRRQRGVSFVPPPPPLPMWSIPIPCLPATVNTFEAVGSLFQSHLVMVLLHYISFEIWADMIFVTTGATSGCVKFLKTA